MAEKIDLIATSEALKGLDSLIAKLTDADKKLNDLADAALTAGKSVGKISSPSDFNTFISSTQKVNAEIAEQSTLLQKLQRQQTETTKTAKQLEQQTYKESQTRNALNKQREKTLAQLDKEQQKLNAAQNLYNKTQQQLNSIQKAYNDLATRKERYNNLSADEEKRLITLQKVTEKYNIILKGVDATVGKHTRNVGNYTSGFNSLSNSINQLTREAPAFANSVQTGFMAISNNLPIFFDAIQSTQKEIRNLRAEGQEVPGLFKQLTSSILSWGTALSVGVTLLTLYGPELAEWAGNLFASSKAIDAVAESQKKLSDSQIEGRKNAVQEQVNVKMLLETAKDANLSYKERAIAVEKLQQQYPFYFENLTKEQILAGKTTKAEKELNGAILARAKGQAAVSKITENQSKLIDYEIESDKIRLKLDASKHDLNNRLWEDGERSTDQTRTRIAAAKGNVKLYQEEFNAIQKKIKAGEIENGVLTKYATVNEKASIGLDYHAEKEKKVAKAKKEHEKLNFSITESEYALQEAILQGQKSEIQARLANPELSLNDRIKARKEFTDKSIELLIFQNEKEKALTLERFKDDKDKNNLALKNKELSQKEYDANLIDLKKKYANEIGLTEIKLSTAINDTREEDYKFFKDIEDKKRDYTQQTQMLIYKGFEETEKVIADNEKLSFKRRQEAFEKQLMWATKQLELEKNSALEKATSAEEQDLINQKYKESVDTLKRIETPLQKAKKATEDWLKSFQSSFLDKSGLGSLNTFFDGTFSKLLEGAKESGKEFEVYFNSIAESAQEAFNLITSYSNENFKNEQDRLKAQKDIAIGYAGESSEAKEKIEDEYQQKVNAIRNREAKAKQKQAMFNIAIDTAQAVMGAIAVSPETFGLPFSAVALTVGAIQMALVASQKIPQYWKGGTHGGGLMMVNDGSGSNFRETIVTPDGNIMKPEGRNVIMDAPKGTQIYTHDQWNTRLNAMLSSKGISVPEQAKNNNLSYAQMDDIMRRNLGNKTSQHINFDRNGFSAYISRNGNITREAGNRGAGLGIKV